MQAQKIFLVLLIAFIGALYDWKARRIPNWLTFGTLFLALVLNFLDFKLHGLLNSLIGFFTGIALLFIPYALGGMGAGDVKLLGAIGALVGYKSVILIFIYSAICGLFLGIIWILFTPGHLKFLLKTGQILPTVDKKQKIPYGIAIFMGTFIYIILGANNIFNSLPGIPTWQ